MAIVISNATNIPMYPLIRSYDIGLAFELRGAEVAVAVAVEVAAAVVVVVVCVVVNGMKPP